MEKSNILLVRRLLAKFVNICFYVEIASRETKWKSGAELANLNFPFYRCENSSSENIFGISCFSFWAPDGNELLNKALLNSRSNLCRNILRWKLLKISFEGLYIIEGKIVEFKQKNSTFFIARFGVIRKWNLRFFSCITSSHNFFSAIRPHKKKNKIQKHFIVLFTSFYRQTFQIFHKPLKKKAQRETKP